MILWPYIKTSRCQFDASVENAFQCCQKAFLFSLKYWGPLCVVSFSGWWEKRIEDPTGNFVADIVYNSMVYNVEFSGRFCEHGGWFRSTEYWVNVWLCHFCPSLKCPHLCSELEELTVFCLLKGVWFLCSRTALESAVSEEGCASESHSSSESKLGNFSTRSLDSDY